MFYSPTKENSSQTIYLPVIIYIIRILSIYLSHPRYI